ncbi:MFS transporter [Pseudarthrobacter enclensis]|uniref:Putative proline/betaine transporter n=1 Tax=Pseudarthrobacter enclensis TaxID=993070 RepID=A0A0V8IL94_9MICC|nr:MFS transporter [Pseudarthrobacter enclensis]KSU75498.1 MFS transporter [Pseudarthrobacter enclensis]
MTEHNRQRRLKVSDVNVVNHATLKKALGGTIVGNTMEWYDVGVFGYLITTMGPVFLPEADKAVQNLFLLGTFAATFIARPLGGVFFGWLGDRIGRQKVLAMTLMIMAAATFAVGLLPGYSVLGIWAAVLLVVLKLVQGFSTGGEYSGATTFVCEHAPDRRRGFYVSFLDMGSYLGFAAGGLVVSILQLVLGQEQMEAWGWRLPFLVAGPLGAVAVYFRMKIEESAAFKATMEAEAVAATHPETGEELKPVGPLGILKAHWRPILLAMILAAAANTVAYALTSYMPTYLTSNKGYSEVDGTLLTIPVLVAMALCIPLTGRLSDRIGRRKVLWIGALSTVVFAVPAFLAIAAHSVPLTFLGLALIAFPVAFSVPNLASALPALFPTEHRYSAMGIAYNFAVAIFGGTAPFIIAALIELTGNDMTIAYYLMGVAVVAAVAIYFLPESAGRHLPGSMPSVDSQEEARQLVETQDINPLLDLESLPFEESFEAARASHHRKPTVM